MRLLGEMLALIFVPVALVILILTSTHTKGSRRMLFHAMSISWRPVQLDDGGRSQ